VLWFAHLQEVVEDIKYSFVSKYLFMCKIGSYGA
jgi:hypothetical protein